MTTGLIIGYGRAGQRHGKILDGLGIRWDAVDPNIIEFVKPKKVRYRSLTLALAEPHPAARVEKEAYDFAVICTPPALHLEQINQCLEAGLPVLCEKPLCALGQLDEAKALPDTAPVMVAYNYRYHPTLKAVQGQIPSLMLCRQNRPNLPEWGLLLDHVSHDLDIINWLTGGVEVTSAKHWESNESDEWFIRAKAGSQSVLISEAIGDYYNTRGAVLTYPDTKTVVIDANMQMYTDMWQAFLSGNYYPGLKEAIQTQELLEDCCANSEMG